MPLDRKPIQRELHTQMRTEAKTLRPGAGKEPVAVQLSELLHHRGDDMPYLGKDAVTGKRTTVFGTVFPVGSIWSAVLPGKSIPPLFGRGSRFGSANCIY